MISATREKPASCPRWREIAAGSMSSSAESPTPDVAAHLRRCSECRERLQELEALGGMLARLVSVSGSDSATPCPAESDWAALADGLVGPERRGELAAHLVECDECACRWEFLAGAGSVIAPERDATAAPGRPGKTRWAAAAVLLLLGTSSLWVHPPEPITGTGEQIWRGGRSTLDARARIDEAGAIEFAWRGWSDAEIYRLKIWDLDGRLLLERDLDAEDLRATTTATEMDAEGATVYWQLEAVVSGRVEAISGLRELHLRRDSTTRQGRGIDPDV